MASLYHDHEAARQRARDALREAIVAETVARYEGLAEKGNLDPVDIAVTVLSWEERHFDQMRNKVIGDLINRYPEAGERDEEDVA